MVSLLHGVVEDDAQGAAHTAMYSADAVPQIGAIVATRTLHGPVTRGEDDGLSLIGKDHLWLGLRAGLLLDEDEFSAFPIASLLAEQ